MSDFNPCRFKQVCVNCMKVNDNERPMMCMQIKCKDFELCNGCGENRTLHGEERLCKNCLKPESAKKIAAKAVKELHAREGGTGTILTSAKITITPPGIAPPEFSDNQRHYYQERWKQYEGYYRNPAAYFICHMLILEEINLNYLNALMITSAGELAFEYGNQRKQSVQTLKMLNEQLPERESQEVMDDEKALSNIYDTFSREKGKRTVNGISRMLSPQAIALIPEMSYPYDAKGILQRCGFQLTHIEQALSKFDEIPLDRTPEEILEFFGYRLKEEYAMPYAPDDPVNYEEDEGAT